MIDDFDGPWAYTKLVSSIYKLAPDNPEGWDIIQTHKDAWLWRSPSDLPPGPCKHFPEDFSADEMVRLLFDHLF